MGKYGLAFDVVDSPKQQRQLRDFLLQNVGGYEPVRHEQWVTETCMPGIEDGSRRALAWWQDGHMIGDAVLKMSGSDVELKNFRMAAFTNRGAARFMMTQVFHESVEFWQERGGVEAMAESIRDRVPVRMILDTPADSTSEAFFAHMGFDRYDTRALYDPDKPDALMQRAVLLD